VVTAAVLATLTSGSDLKALSAVQLDTSESILAATKTIAHVTAAFLVILTLRPASKAGLRTHARSRTAKAAATILPAVASNSNLATYGLFLHLFVILLFFLLLLFFFLLLLFFFLLLLLLLLFFPRTIWTHIPHPFLRR
jgi:hypothetical protein